jgi:hypothetical protein
LIIDLASSSPSIVSPKGTGVPSQKFVVYIGELSAALARRADDRISGIFRGGPTLPASSRAAEIYDELLGRDTGAYDGDIQGFIPAVVMFPCGKVSLSD